MTLSSNNNTDSNNTIAMFDTQLHKTYELGNDWYVGLAEISYTKSWFNVKKDVSVMLVDEQEVIYPCDKKLKAGFYKNEIEISNALNDIIKTIIGDISFYPSIDFDVYTRRVVIKHGITKYEYPLYLWLSDEFCEMIGVKFHGPKETSTIDENGKLMLNTIKGGLTSFRAYDISAGIHSLYLYCDIIEPSFVGDTFANILRSININNTDTFGKDCENIYNPIQYHKLSRSRFQRISIGLFDDAGELIPFKFGRTKIVLHFKKYGERMGREILS